MLPDRFKKQTNKDRQVHKVIPISWRKLIPGVILIGLGVFIGSFYIADNKLIVFGMIAAIALAGGGFLVYYGLKAGASGYTFQTAAGKNGLKGDENTIAIFAARNSETDKDTPVIIRFLKLNKLPRGARLHYVRCLKKHFYEVYNDTVKKQMAPVILRDKKSHPPELFKIPAVMQTYKDALEYSPPTLMQKVAPGIMLLAMGLVGILMVMTGG